MISMVFCEWLKFCVSDKLFRDSNRICDVWPLQQQYLSNGDQNEVILSLDPDKINPRWEIGLLEIDDWRMRAHI